MNEKDSFIGMGKNPNPNVPDIPLGLGMALFQEPGARQYFESLSDSQKTKIISYVHDGNETGQEVQEKITQTIDGLKRGSLNFF